MTLAAGARATDPAVRTAAPRLISTSRCSNDLSKTGESVFYTTRQPPGYPSTLYDPNVPPDRVDANYEKIVSRQDPRLLRGAVKIAF